MFCRTSDWCQHKVWGSKMNRGCCFLWLSSEGKSREIDGTEGKKQICCRTRKSWVSPSFAEYSMKQINNYHAPPKTIFPSHGIFPLYLSLFPGKWNKKQESEMPSRGITVSLKKKKKIHRRHLLKIALMQHFWAKIWVASWYGFSLYSKSTYGYITNWSLIPSFASHSSHISLGSFCHHDSQHGWASQ